MSRWINYVLILFLLLGACRKDTPIPEEETFKLTIFSINDAHGQIDNFSKIKYIVDEAEEEGNVLVVSAGDLFSGNPVVDFIGEKGYPMIDLMNRSGFDVAVLGNHEFDYGQVNLTNRIEQADFDFICANADMTGAILPQSEPYVTFSYGELDVTVLGMVQTSYTSGAYLPATHPYRVEGITFTPAEDVIGDYATLKEDTDADLVVLLSHLGTGNDYYMAEYHPYMDLIIGGHSHAKIDDQLNDVYIYQCSSYLRFLGKISLTIKGAKIISEEFELISLNDYAEYDSELAAIITDYNDVPELEEVIGYNETFLDRGSDLACLYTEALRQALDADVSFQNGGGIRANLDEGDITVREIYSIDPFNNNAQTYTMKVEYLKRFFEETNAGLHYSGLIIEDAVSGGISIKDLSGNELDNDTELKIAINDFIPAIYEGYFINPVNSGKTTAEEIIDIIRDYPGNINFSGCNSYYKY